MHLTTLLISQDKKQVLRPQSLDLYIIHLNVVKDGYGVVSLLPARLFYLCFLTHKYFYGEKKYENKILRV